jgi:hypothetical protein
MNFPKINFLVMMIKKLKWCQGQHHFLKYLKGWTNMNYKKFNNQILYKNVKNAIFTIWSTWILHKRIVLQFSHGFYWKFVILQICDKTFKIEPLLLSHLKYQLFFHTFNAPIYVLCIIDLDINIYYYYYYTIITVVSRLI